MNKTFLAWPAVLLLVGLSAHLADAQVGGPRVGSPPPAPTVSPYINLFRNGNSPAFNYYGLVRPQFQTNAGLQSLQQQLLLSQGSPLPGAAGPEDVLITGHAAVFMNLGGYFQSATGGLQPARGITATAARPATSTPAPTRLPLPGPR